MTLTLTAWWKKLDDETRSLAGIFGDINYPASLTVPYTNVKADKEMTPWEAVHAMASLGSAIETNVMSGEGIASNIATAAKNLGDPIPNSPRHLPAITDEKAYCSLWYIIGHNAVFKKFNQVIAGFKMVLWANLEFKRTRKGLQKKQRF